MSFINTILIFSLCLLSKFTINAQETDSLTSSNILEYKWQISHRLILTDFITTNPSLKTSLNDMARGMEINFGRHIKKGIWLTLPLRVGFSKTSVDSTGKPYYGADITLLKEFRINRFAPYVQSGSSVQLLSNKFNWGIPIALGLGIQLDKGFFLNFQSLYRQSFDSDHNSFIHSVGVTFRFGKNKDKFKPNLKLSNEPIPAQLDTQSIDIPINPWIVKDTDQDGVADSLDRCPLVFGPMSNWGCPITNGLKHPLPDTVQKVVAISQNMNKEPLDSAVTVYFEFDKYQLTNDSRAVLDKIISQYYEKSIKELTILGYTDNLGSDDYNIDLSKKRANMCADYLVKNKLSVQHIIVHGLGESQPFSQNPQERYMNRRVIILIRL